jgi:hypothetical protein
MRWSGLEGGLLLITVGSWSLDKFLRLGRVTIWGSTDILTMFWMTLITTSHCLQKAIPNMSEYKAGVLKTRYNKPYEEPMRNRHSTKWTVLWGQICPVRTDQLGKISINHVLLLENLSNFTQWYSNTLGTTYSRIMTCIVGYKSTS